MSEGITYFCRTENVYHITSNEKCILLIGPADEKYVISEKELDEHFNLISRSPYNLPYNRVFNAYPKNAPEFVMAKKLDGNHYVLTADGEVKKANEPDVPHGDGDYIVEVKPHTPYIVNGLVFSKMYEKV